MMDMTQIYTLLLHEGHSPGKTKNNISKQICLKYILTNSLLSILMTYVRKISNWPDLCCQIMDMTQHYSPLLHKGNFPGRTKNNESKYA